LYSIEASAQRTPAAAAAHLLLQSTHTHDTQACARAHPPRHIETQDEVVLVTTQRPDGSAARIVFRNGGAVDAATLEQLCEKV
jgi:hypothetical protein